jgi:hypothetical protein
MEPQFKPPRPLREFVPDVNAWWDGGWLFIRDDEPKIHLGISCYQQDWDDRALSPEEQDEMEVRLDSLGYSSFLEWGQLSCIVENLAQQRPQFSEDELERAIRYYWENDAFIDLQP